MPTRRAPPKRRKNHGELRALALASGGIAGLLYELGVLEALDDACQPFRSTDFDIYIGVGSGAAGAALLANGVPAREISLAIEGRSSTLPPFDLDRMMAPNYSELWRKGIQAPVALARALYDNLDAPSEMSVQDVVVSLTGVLPSGLYVTDYVEEYLREALNGPGLADRFEDLRKELFIVATDVDSGKSAVFCRGDRFGIPISRAVAATSAIPMLFAPVEIDGRHYVDGTMTKMLHLSLALHRGSTFNFCVTPIRPLERLGADRRRAQPIAETGVVSVAKQALRTLLYTRLLAGIDQYRDRPKNVDIVLVRPGPEEGGALFYNVTKARTRAMLKERGHMKGMEEIRAQQALFGRHGISLSNHLHRSGGLKARLGGSLDDLERRVARRVKRAPALLAARGRD